MNRPAPRIPNLALIRRRRERADRVRACPLEPLAAQLGYRRDPRNRARWKRPGSVLSLTPTRFFDHCQGRGGGGAIDLVMHARGCRFLEAVEWLEANRPLPPGGQRPQSPAAPRGLNPSHPLRLPPPNPRHWPPVRDFLVQVRGLCPHLLTRCLRSGLLYPDSRRNAVFLCRNRDRIVTGAEIVGTAPQPGGQTFKAMAPGSRKAQGGFQLPTAPSPPQALLLVESALDALSAFLLLAPLLPPHTLVVSTAGLASALPPWLLPFAGLPILCGYDADPAGDLAAHTLRNRYPRLCRLRPLGAKDWNDLRRQSLLLPSQTRPPPPSPPYSLSPPLIDPFFPAVVNLLEKLSRSAAEKIRESSQEIKLDGQRL